MQPTGKPQSGLRKIALFAMVCTAFPVLPVSSFSQEKPAGTRRDDMVAVVERVKGAVVNIHSERISTSSDDPFRPGIAVPQRVNGMGTGIVLDPRGYIVTNFHVIDDVQSLRVRLVDGTTCPARVLATDKDSDLALIKIEPPKPLPVVPLGTAQDLMLAERVIAIGNAYGYEHTVTVGHVSAMKRDVTLNKEISYKSLIQTQTPINPGNSGGPLMNRMGEVVGVNVAIRAGAQNIAFAIPVDTMIARAAEMLSLRRRGVVKHGLIVADRWERKSDDSTVRRWVLVQRVDADSPAAEAGVKPGDLLESIDGSPILTSIDVERAFLERNPNAALQIKVLRNGESAELKLTLRGNAGVPAVLVAANSGEVPAVKRLGLILHPVGIDVTARINRELRGGLLIQDVAGGSAAARAGLDKGDILIGLHLWETLSSDNITFVVNHKDLTTFHPIKTYFVRDGKVRETTLTLE